MKKIACLVASFISLASFAQETAKVSTQEAFDYSRSNLTIVAINGNGFDSQTLEWADQETFGGKFDMNKIPTKEVRNVSSSEDVMKALNQQSVGKQVLDYWFHYDGNKFDDTVIKERSRYNMTDADVLRESASKVQIFTNKTLLKNSYVMASGIEKVERKTDKKNNVTYSAHAYCYVYELVLTDSIIQEIWNNWLDESSDEQARNFYNNLQVDLKLVASCPTECTDENRDAAIKGALGGDLDDLEKNIEAWQVVSTIYEKHPLGAKIGKKEGLRNSDRYRAFKIVENENGELESKAMGYVRATKIIDNRQNATGESECSNFYQISGKLLKDGMYIKQSKDAQISVSASGVAGGYNIAQLDVDYLMHTSHTLGLMTYGGLSVGYFSGKTIYDDDKKLDYIPVSLNFGVGIHPHRVLEITPSIGIGGDYFANKLENSQSYGDDEEEFLKKIAIFARGGLKVGLQVYYPVQIFVRVDYSTIIDKGEQYVECKDDRFDKLSFGGGIRINF